MPEIGDTVEITAGIAMGMVGVVEAIDRTRGIPERGRQCRVRLNKLIAGVMRPTAKSPYLWWTSVDRVRVLGHSDKNPNWAFMAKKARRHKWPD